MAGSSCDPLSLPAIAFFLRDYGAFSVLSFFRNFADILSTARISFQPSSPRFKVHETRVLFSFGSFFNTNIPALKLLSQTCPHYSLTEIFFPDRPVLVDI